MSILLLVNGTAGKKATGVPDEIEYFDVL